MSKKYLYKFLKAGLKSAHDGSRWTVGEWREVEAPTRECVGLNASECIPDALGYVKGPILAKVECGGTIIKGNDKWTCQRMRIVSTADWGKVESVRLAIFCAELSLSKFEKKYPDDKRSRLAIEAAKAWLANPSSAARAASAASDAASAAVSAAASAASDASSAWAAWAASAASAASAADSAAWAASDASEAASAASAAWADSAADSAARAKIHRHALTLVTWKGGRT
jgi:hypothetical protein